jgi:hypothetical protein
MAQARVANWPRGAEFTAPGAMLRFCSTNAAKVDDPQGRHMRIEVDNFCSAIKLWFIHSNSDNASAICGKLGSN